MAQKGTRRAAVKAESTPITTTRKSGKSKQSSHDNNSTVKVKEELSSTPANMSKKRARGAVKYEEEAGSEVEDKPCSKRAKASKRTPKKSTSTIKKEEDLPSPELLASTSTTPTKPKSNPYNLSPGTSPYPTYAHPTPSECAHVVSLLSSIHGNISAPKTLSAPSLTTSGCGEVPSVLDALIRTRLSAATNNANSSRAFRGIVDAFGTLKSGIGKGSVDWDAVRRAPVSTLFAAIQSGGLADVKSRDIQKILNLVKEENEVARKEEKESAPPDGVLSLDHMHGMPSEAAFDKLVQYPGVGPKTASCVLLFCMQRPSFAVDTHVFRLTRWLGWTPSENQVRAMGKEVVAASQDKRVRKPPPVTRNSTYAHLDVRIPDELKYQLHYLFIKHGKTCPSCSAKKDKSIVVAWQGKACPLKNLKTKSRGKVLAEVGEEGIQSENDENVKNESNEEDDVESESDVKENAGENLHGIEVK